MRSTTLYGHGRALQPTSPKKKAEILRKKRRAKIIAIICGITLPLVTFAGYGYWWWSGRVDRDVSNPCAGESRERLSQVLSSAKLSEGRADPAPSMLGNECNVIDTTSADDILKQGYINTYRIDSREQEEWAERVAQDRCDDIEATRDRIPVGEFNLSDVDEFCVVASRPKTNWYSGDENRGVDVNIAARRGVDVIRISYSEDPGDRAAVSKTAEKIATVVIEALEDGDED